jgi:hypothetical protein
MKKIILFVAVMMCINNAIAQRKIYSLFEFMKVTPAQESAYLETESFWQKIHNERIKTGEILAWQLWRLQPGGENQDYQYVAVQVFDDEAKFFKKGTDDLYLNVAKKAFPKMSDADLLSKRTESLKSRDLAETILSEQIDQTKGKFKVSAGAVMGINLMKVNPDNITKYQNAESKIFKPEWQNRVDGGRAGSWSLLKVMRLDGNPLHNGVSYVSLDKFKDFNQLYGSPNKYNTLRAEPDNQAWKEALATREMNSYTAVLIKKTPTDL